MSENFFQFLNSENLQDPGYLYWIPDRALSPSALLHFKESRMKVSRWPHSGVYESAELASLFIRHFEQKDQRLYKTKLASSWDILTALAELSWSNESLSRRFLHFKESKKFWSLGKSFWPWREVLSEIQKEKTDTLREDSQQILTWLGVEASLDTKGMHSNPWSLVEIALRLLEETKAPPHLNQLFLMDPRLKIKALVLPLFCELRPLETLFLKKLEKIIPLLVLPLSPSTASPLAWEELTQASALKIFPEHSHLFWGFTESIPGPWELDALLPQALELSYEFPLYSQNDSKLSQKTLQSVELGLGYLRSGGNLKHPYSKDGQFKSQLEGQGFSIEDFQEAEGLNDFLNHFEIPSDLESLSRLCNDFPAWDIFEALILCGHIKTDNPVIPLPSRFQKRGIALGPLQDLGLSPSQNFLLWSNKKAFSEIQNPLSNYNLKRQEYPASLRKILEGVGIALPELSREIEILKTLLHTYKNKILAFESKVEAEVNLKTPLPFQKAKESKTFSPSTVEALNRCPARYLLEREKKLGDFTLWDPEQMDALSLGSWVHWVLEKFLSDPDWPSPRGKIYFLFEKSIDEFFPYRVSPSYRDLLLTKAQVLTNFIEDHILNFEKPFQDICSIQTRWIESPFEIKRPDRTFIGKIDRVDFLNKHDFFVWDYKTGQVTGLPKTQIKKGKVQIWSYIYAVRSKMEELRFLGGGYLNPLAPDRSMLFLSESFVSPERVALEKLFENRAYPYKILSEADQKTLLEACEEQLKLAEQVLAEGIFFPHPATASECPRCPVAGVCGRPYLIEESSDESSNEREEV